MAKKKKVEATEKVVQEKVDNVTKVDLVKTEESDITKVDLSEPPMEEAPVEEVTAEATEVEVESDIPVVEEITEEVEELATQAEEAINESMETGKDLPENIQKLIDFMEDTGGDLTDYVKLNQDYSELDDNSLLKEYYKKTKPHLNLEEINFLMEDNFSFDEDMDEDIDVRRKKLALKEQVAQAKLHLDGEKSKYYEDIKSGSKLTEEQQKAINFFDRYKTESKEDEKAIKHSQSVFTQKTNEVFNEGFKGFEYNIGDKRFRFNVNDADNVKQSQSDITNFTKKFLDKNSTLKDAKGYHKSMYTAMNADAVANHFYEQGRTDALKDSIAKSKNINMDPRQSHGVVEAGGIKVRVLGESSNDYKFKIKQK